MHDFILAKEIIEGVLAIVKEKKLQNISVVRLGIGSISMAHDGIPEHAEEIQTEHLQFGLKSLVKNTVLEGAKFEIERIEGNIWRIENIVTL